MCCIVCYIVLSVSTLHTYLCPHHNIWPNIVYCCSTKTTILIPNCLHNIAKSFFLSFTKFHYTLHLLVSEIAYILPEVVYCCFTRTTVFTGISH